MILLIALCGVTGCGGSDGPPNLLLITVDTLRPDHLGYMGSDRPTSPVIDDLASRGVVFDNAMSQAGWTLPSVATILTGQYPKDHGATDFHWSLDRSLPTLASILHDNGYATQGYVSHVMLTPSYGLGDDFDRYDFSILNIGNPHDVESSKELTDKVLDLTRDLRKPYFIWVHYFDPHFAYLPHAAFARFGNRDIDRYDGEIAHTDYHIGRLLRYLDDDNTIVVFTADHGEEFGEHGGKYHYTLHGEVMRIPFIVKAPGLAPTRRHDSMEQIDMLPTILGLLGIAPPADLPGRDVFAGTPDDTPVFIERDRPPPWRQRGIIDGDHKLFVIDLADSASIPPASRGTEVPVTNVAPGVYLYDITRDPGETKNLFREDDALSMKLLGLVTEHFSTGRAERESVELDQDMIKKLKSLGYLR